MGKNQHSKDKQYITATEWATEGGGYRDQARHAYRNLPFTHCALSLQPFTVPMCTKDGTTYDILQIVPFLRQYGTDPKTGEKLAMSDLIKLHFHKNAAGEYHCPITFKVFNEHTHIVAIAVTGQVYSFEAVQTLNIKPKNWKDLMTEEPFKRSDIITIQDPVNPEPRNITDFHCYKNNLRVAEEDALARNDAAYKLRNPSNMAQSVLQELAKSEEVRLAALAKEKELQDAEEAEIAKLHSGVEAKFSMGKMSSSFTSTSADVAVTNEKAKFSKEYIILKHVRDNRKKAYVSIHTSLGKLNVELRSDQVPKTCYNFIQLALQGYYNNTIFHRSIPGFMIQGGDPTGTGTGGESYWKVPFEDEIKDNLRHSVQGTLSMANSGRDTNKSQFFFTYAPAPHLDNKHTVFGTIVGGIETLSAMERVETDKKNRPKVPIEILKIDVLTNPFSEKTIAEEVQAKKDKAAAKVEQEKPVTIEKPKSVGSGVDMYLKPALKRSAQESVEEDSKVESKPAESFKKPKAAGFGSFDSW